MEKLAINGGKKIRNTYFPPQTNIGIEEVEAAKKVVESGLLSGYRGSWQDAFFGGPKCREFENDICVKFNCKFTISCNSATSALMIALGAAGIGNIGDEVVTSPYSMSCSATTPLVWNSIPVFSDIERDYFCIDPECTKNLINEHTKVILPVSLFGQPYDFENINSIASSNGLIVISDDAQAIGSYYKDKEGKKYAGILADMGVFSWTQGKNLYIGEGGCILTNNEDLAMRCMLIRNHAEAVISSMDTYTFKCNENKMLYDHSSIDNNMLGFNLRMTEVQAAMAIEQLKKLDNIIKAKNERVKAIRTALSDIPAIIPTSIRENCTHSWYVDSYYWNSEKADGLHRDKFINAVKAELMPSIDRIDRGVCIGNGYIEPLYLSPLFQRRKLYGGSSFPFNHATTNLEENYKFGSHPVVEDLWKNTLFLSLYHSLDLQENDISDISNAFYKCWSHRKELI